MPDSGSRTSAERAAASAQPGGARAAVADCDRSHALIRETLLQVARQRELLDPHACGALFTLIETGRAIRRYLASVILELGLTEAKFCALTILHRLDPQSSTAAELAYHSGVSRSAMTDIIDQMVAQGLVKRERSSTDRRTVHITLSETGRGFIEGAIVRFMTATAGLLENIPEMSAPRISAFCEEINLRLSQPPRPETKDGDR